MEKVKSELAPRNRKTKIRFTEYFHIPLKQKELDFLDIYVNADRVLFLDPGRLLKYDDELSCRMREHVVTYFDRYLQYVRAGDKVNAVRMMRYLREPKEIHLGYAREGYRGNAVGRVKGLSIYERFSQSKAVQTGMLKDLEESALLVKGIDRDIISDMMAMICKADLIAFTQQQCRKHRVPMRDCRVGRTWMGGNHWPEIETKLPVYGGEPIILVPKRMVGNILMLDSQDFYRNEVLTSVQEDIMRADQSMVIVLKNGNKRCAVTKKELREGNEYSFSKDLIYSEVQKKPHILRAYRHRKKYTQDELDE